MQNLFKPGVDLSQQPLRLRWIIALCALLIAVMSTAQVCHSHDLTLRPGSHQSLPDSNPDHCPLCVAMHSAMPSAQHGAPEPLLLIHSLDAVAVDVQRTFRWRFQLACRPPPADPLRS